MSFDEMYDEMLHDEFRTGSPGRGDNSSSSRPVAGMARYRTPALVGAGGLACATVGAFLGGLGGYFALSPASAHSVTDTNEQVPLAAAADSAFHSAVAAPAAKIAAAAASVTHTYTTNDSHGSAVATFAAAVSPILNSVPLVSPVLSVATGSPSTVAPPANTGGTTKATTPAGPLGQAVGVLSLGLTNVLTNLTAALEGIVEIPGNPTAGLGDVVTPLTNVVLGLTGTLSNLSTLMPLPVSTATLPVLSAVAPILSGGSLPVLGTTHTTAAAPITKNTPASTPSSPATALVPVIQSVAAAATGSAGSGLPSVPSLPLQTITSSLPSLPIVSTVVGALPTLPTITLPAVTVAPTNAASGTTTCPALPTIPTTPLPTILKTTITVGPVKVGVSVGGPATGATVCVAN